MKKPTKRALIIFLSVFVIVTLVNLLTSHDSPLHIQSLRLAIGQFWNILMIPGAIIAVPLNLIGFDILVCPFTDCRGSLDGGPIAKYEVTTISITFGILYALLAIGIDKLIRKTKSHKNKKQA